MGVQGRGGKGFSNRRSAEMESGSAQGGMFGGGGGAGNKGGESESEREVSQVSHANGSR